jgi:hypothetical protein
VTASFAPLPAPTVPRRPGAVSAFVIGIVGVLGFLGLVLAGLVFFSLAIAFPIAVPLAQSYGLPVSAHDAELASQFAGFSWAFVVAAVAAFGASIGVLALTIRSIAPSED